MFFDISDRSFMSRIAGNTHAENINYTGFQTENATELKSCKQMRSDTMNKLIFTRLKMYKNFGDFLIPLHIVKDHSRYPTEILLLISFILIHYLHNTIMHLFYPTKILHTHCLQFLLGHEH